MREGKPTPGRWPGDAVLRGKGMAGMPMARGARPRGRKHASGTKEPAALACPWGEVGTAAAGSHTGSHLALCWSRAEGAVGGSAFPASRLARRKPLGKRSRAES